MLEILRSWPRLLSIALWLGDPLQQHGSFKNMPVVINEPSNDE
jgi:hypothetical protein